MTILGQQTLLDDKAPDRYLACRECLASIENNGVRSVDKYVSTCSGFIQIEHGTGELVFEGNGHTEHGDPVKTLGYECESCGVFKRRLEDLVMWRVGDDG